VEKCFSSHYSDLPVECPVGISSNLPAGDIMEKEHLEIILENIDKKFDIVIEGYSTLDRKIDDW